MSRKKLTSLEYQGYYFTEALLVNLKTNNLINSLYYVCNHIDCKLSKEIFKALKGLENGMNFKESFTNLKNKFQSKYIINLINLLIKNKQKEKTLYKELSEFCTKYSKDVILNEKNKSNDLPLKIAIFSMLFIVPIIILIISLPIIIEKFF